jgi:ceramide glucosyltransferase
VLGAMDISYRFLPAVVVGIATGLATPMLGPTFALRREVLAEIGGFAAFADRLADDYEIGRAVRDAGLRTQVPHFTVGHCGYEAGVRDLCRHELRWTRTIQTVDRGGFIGSGVTHCLALSIGGALLAGPVAGGIELVVVALALAARLLLALRVDMVTGTHAGPLALLPLRDLLSAGLFVATFFGNSVIWRGTRYRVAIDGRISPC